MPEGESVSAAVIIEHAMLSKGLDPVHDRKTRGDYYQKFLMQLRAEWVRGKVEKVGSGKGVKWRLRETNGAD